jgi:hypothetical protein
LRWLLALGLIASACSYAIACGSAGKDVGPAPKASPAPAIPGVPETVASATTKHKEQLKEDRDHDNDNLGTSYYDDDDPEVLDYGRAASPSEQRQVTSLVKRYYVAAAAGDGAAGCRLLYTLFAESLPEEEDRSSTPRATTCAAALAKIFKRDHAQLAAGLARLRVTGLRVKGTHAYALLSGSRPERYLILHRELGAWKMVAVIDNGLP